MATSATPQQLVIVLDFGAQYGQLIARRVRDLGVYSEIVPCDITADEVRELAPSAIILSGGPASVYAEDAPSVDAAIFELGIPVLGFCYGQQAMAVALGGAVGHTDKGEYGPAKITRAGSDSRLLADTPHEQTVWMSHRDAVTEVPDGFVITSHTDICPVASMEDAERGLYATQFHPEVRHTPHGNQMLANFLFDICRLEKSWTMDSIIEDSIAAIREQVGDSRVILGLSGGVDSSVVAALVSKAIGDQVTCVIGAQELGALGIWVGAVPSDRLLWAMKQYQPTFFWSSPSYAWQLGQKALEKGYDPKTDFASLKHIIISGEPGGSIESTRKAIEEIWDASVYDFFGLSDIYGACAAMCDAKDGLHIIEDQILVEVVDPVTGEVLPDGERGEIVYTTLKKRARPMIRFRSGDIGHVNRETCECGRTMTRIYIQGRKDEMFIVSAVNVFPSDIEYIVRNDKGLSGEYLIRVYDENYTTRYEVSVERVFGSDEPYDEIAKRVENELKTHTGVRPAKVLVFDTDKLGTSSEHKAKRFIDERNQNA